MPGLNLSILNGTFAICRLSPHEDVPNWVDLQSFASITRTNAELSIVCMDKYIPTEVKADRGWRCFRIEGPLDLTLTGILASIAIPMADARIGIFAISTFDTDYVLIKADALVQAIEVLEKAGHRIVR